MWAGLLFAASVEDGVDLPPLIVDPPPPAATLIVFGDGGGERLEELCSDASAAMRSAKPICEEN